MTKISISEMKLMNEKNINISIQKILDFNEMNFSFWTFYYFIINSEKNYGSIFKYFDKFKNGIP